MPLPETIKASLIRAAAQGNAGLLRDAYIGVVNALNSNSSADRASLELLVLCAETALKVNEFEIAAECLETYFLEATRYGGGQERVGHVDQFLCRAYYARACVESERTRVLKGEDLVTGTLDSIKFLMKGLELVKAAPRYAFLVYNGTVHYWQVSRPLQRDGKRTSLLASQEPFVQALVATVTGQEEWKARCLGALGMCYLESGKPDDAVKALDQAIGLAAGFHDLLLELKAAKTHVGQVSGKGKADTAGVTPDAARALIQTVASQPTLPAAQVEPQLEEAWKKVDPNPEQSAKGVNLHVVADIAWVAAKAGCLDLARKCAMRANASQDLLPRVWSDLTISAVRLAQLGESRYKLTSRTVTEHCSVLDALDQTLSQFKRLGDPGGVQDACRLIWNAGLLLLQPNLRKHVKKTFAAAAKALEEIDSPLNRLRAALHLEVAKADYLDESFPKAAKEVKKGLALDYIAPDEEIKKFRLQRPLDRYLDPMYEALDLKTSITRLPETDLERVVLALERAKDVRNPDVKASQLKQLIAMVLDLPPAIPPEASDETEDRAERQHSARLRTTTWCEIVKAAWSVRLSDIVALATPHALAVTWDPAVDKEMVVMQAEVAFIEADALVYALLKEEDEPTPPTSWVPANERLAENDGEAPQRTPAMEPDAMQERLPQAILDGMELGLKCAEPWLVLNGAVYAWNHYIHFLNGQHVVVVEPVFKAVTDTLFRMDKESVDPVFVCAMAGAYAEAVEHRIMLGVMGVEWPPQEEEDDIEMEEEEEEDEEDDKRPVYCPLGAARMAAGKILGENGKLDADAIEELKPAIGILEGAIERAGERPSQSMLETYARILKLCGREPVLPPSVKGPQEAAGKVIATIESLSTQTGLEITQLEAQVQTAIEQLRSMGKMATPEFWAKLAQVALQVKATGHALTCAKEVFKCVFGETIQGEDIQDKEDAQDISDRTWYWLALSEIVHGHAVVGLVKPGAQPRSVQGRLRLIAIGHFVTAARFAEFINRKDIVESAARALWNSVGDYLLSPVTRRLLAAPLQGLLNVLNKVGCSDPDFQVALNCLLLESYEDAQDWTKGVKQANTAFKSLKNTLHLPLWEYKTTALARSGVNVPEEMGVAKQYTDPVHARTWQLLAQQLGGHYDQLAARKQSMDIVKKMPWVRYEYLLEYAEWLALETGEPDAAEDTLWVAIDILTEVEVEGDEDDEEDEDGGRSARSGSRVGSKAGSRAPTRASRAGSKAGSKAGSRAGSSRSKASKSSKRSSAIRSAVGASTAGKTVVSQTELNTIIDFKQPEGLNVRHLEALFRAFTMLANLAPEHADRKEYALTAHYYAMRMVSATFQGAVNAPAIKGERGPDGKRLPAPETPPVPPMPEQLQDWAAWAMDDATRAALDRVRSRDKLEIISRRSIACPELTMRYLEFLADLLSGLGLHLHTLPIFQLHGLVATLSARNPTLASISQLLLSSALEDLGALEAASAAIERAGDLSITADELTNAQYHIDQMNCVKAVIAESSATVGRWRTNSGRFSFLKDTAGDDARDDRPMSAERKAAQTTIHELESGELRSDPFNDNVPETGAETDSLKESAKLEPEFVSAVSQKMVKANKAAAKSWLTMAPFQPLTPAETWIRKAQWLLKHGQYGPAKEMVDKAYEWSVSKDEMENKARCHMLYAEMYFLAREHESALVQVQAAQQIGGNVAFWHRSVLTYCQYRRELNGHTADCKAALEACIGLLQQLSKENAASFVDTTTTISSLNSSLAQLLLEEVAENIRTGQAFKHLYERAVKITRDSMEAMTGIGGVGYVFAIMAHADVLFRNPVKEHDRRPAHLQVLEVLKGAEQVARQLLDSSRQPDQDVNLNLPCSRLLSTVLAKMAEVSLTVAQEREVHEPEDRNNQRPEFPRMSNTGSESSYNPVAAFLDQTASKEDGGFVHPEQDAVVFATTASMLTSRKTEKAQALAQLGEALSFQFWCSMPGGFLHFNPWTELIEEPVLLKDYQFPGAEFNTEVPQEVPATDEAQPLADPAATPPEPEGEKPPVDEEANPEDAEGAAAADGEPAADEEAGDPTDSAATADATDPTSEEAPAEETPVKEAEPVGFKLWRKPRQVPELSEQLREQAVSALQKSMKAAADERLWSVAERAALDLANCNGDTINQAAAANAVILAQSFSAAAFLESQYLQACQASDMDAILLRQQQILQATSPVWPDSGPGSQSLANFSKSGNASAVLNVGAEVSEILEAIPATCRVVSFQLSPESDYLYAACLNGPQNDSVVSDGADKPPVPAAAKDKKGGPTGAAGPPVSSRASSALRMQLDSERLSSVVRAVKEFRRNTKQEIESMREPFSGSSEEGKQNRSQSRQKKGSRSSKKESSPPKARPGSRAGLGSQEPEAPEAPKVVLYDPAINLRWAEVLEQMEALFAPLLPMLREFLPEADGNKKSDPKVTAGGAGGLQAIILLDHRLAVLPVEALKIFRQCAAVSRDFSLHICFNRIGSLNPDGTPADPPLINLNKFAYFVDVRGEDRGKDATGKGQVGRKREGISDDFNKLIKPRFGQMWSGWASDGSKVASEPEMAQLMQGGSGLVYYGLGRMLSYIPPPIIAGVQLNKCNLAIVMDKANNIPAAERQKYLDNHKMDKERALESSPAAAAMLSLRGVRNIVINTAFSVVDTNHDVLVGVLDGLRSGEQLGTAHRMTLNNLETELDYLKYNAVLYGVPFIQAHTSGK